MLRIVKIKEGKTLMESPKKWFVFKYEHIDYLDNIELLEPDSNKALLDELKQLFKKKVGRVTGNRADMATSFCVT